MAISIGWNLAKTQALLPNSKWSPAQFRVSLNPLDSKDHVHSIALASMQAFQTAYESLWNKIKKLLGLNFYVYLHVKNSSALDPTPFYIRVNAASLKKRLQFEKKTFNKLIKLNPIQFTRAVKQKLEAILPQSIPENLNAIFSKISCCENLLPGTLKHTVADRFADIYCLPATQVQLIDATIPVNANFVDLEGAKRRFIAAQTPLKGIFRQAFYDMILENQVEDVVCLVNPKEQQKDPTLAYFPRTVGFSKKGWECKKIFKNKKASYICYYLQHISGAALRIHQCAKWPDDGVIKPKKLIRFIKCLDKNISVKNPLLIQCLAGVGRTGTFLTLYHLLHTDSHFNRIPQVLKKIRSQRLHSVRTCKQFKLIYRCCQLYQKYNSRQWSAQPSQ